MTGIAIQITAKGNAREKLRDLIDRIEDKATFFAAASSMMHGQTMDRFREQRDPTGSPWKPLADDTVEMRGGRATPILEDTGSFRMQISPQPEAGRAVVTTGPFVQAAILQKGGKAGRGHKVTIPARPYFGFGAADIDDITDLAESMILGDR